MILKVLGAVDILIGIVFWFYGVFGIFPEQLIVFLGLVLVVKGLIFVIGMDVASVLDVVAGAVIIVAGGGVSMPFLVVVLVAVFLVQKGVVSLVS